MPSAHFSHQQRSWNRYDREEQYRQRRKSAYRCFVKVELVMNFRQDWGNGQNRQAKRYSR